jgi:predicted alternative tryptophan synthase beta-subunit
LKSPPKIRNTKYALGSVLNHVLLHQTVIGQEAIEQMALAGDEPDVIIGCTGGGSNFAGLVMPFLGRKLKGKCHARIVAVEPAACPSLTKGKLRLRLRRHRPSDAAGQDAHAGQHLHASREFTRAGCAITAWRRWFRT